MYIYNGKFLQLITGNCTDKNRTVFYTSMLPYGNICGWISAETAQYIIKKCNYNDNSELKILNYLDRF